MAIVIGYVGTKYRGLQINYEVEEKSSKLSVEAVVRDALLRAGIISPLNVRPLEKKVDWSRSSRTDAGVHALRLVIAAKLLVHEDDINAEGHCPPLVAEINKELPSDIRCFGAVRVPRCFDAKSACSWREYEYLLPTHLVCRPGEDVSQVGVDVLASNLERAMRHFEGCHSYHNFCRAKASDFAWKKDTKEKAGKGGNGGKGKGKKRKAAEMQAPIKDVAEDVADVACPSEEEHAPAEKDVPEDAVSVGRTDATWIEVCGKQSDTGTFRERPKEVLKHTRSTIHMVQVEPVYSGKLLRVRLRGQFFLYNQIRLMIGSAVGICTGVVTDELVKMALLLEIEMHMPLAPAVGLHLRTAGFTEMDRRAGFCSMDAQQAQESMMPSEGFVLVEECHVGIASELEEQIWTEVTRQWHEAGQLETWAEKLAAVRGPSEETLAELKNLMAAATAKEAEFKASQTAGDLKRRENQLTISSGSFAGVMPRGFAAELMVRFRILPGRRLSNIQWSLANRMRGMKDAATRPACFASWPPDTAELLAYTAEVGAEVLAEEGASSLA